MSSGRIEGNHERKSLQKLRQPAPERAVALAAQ
jgi:hypothetical protein